MFKETWRLTPTLFYVETTSQLTFQQSNRWTGTNSGQPIQQSRLQPLGVTHACRPRSHVPKCGHHRGMMRRGSRTVSNWRRPPSRRCASRSCGFIPWDRQPARTLWGSIHDTTMCLLRWWCSPTLYVMAHHGGDTENYSRMEIRLRTKTKHILHRFNNEFQTVTNVM